VFSSSAVPARVVTPLALIFAMMGRTLAMYLSAFSLMLFTAPFAYAGFGIKLSDDSGAAKKC
jgi:hypothetical protein